MERIVIFGAGGFGRELLSLVLDANEAIDHPPRVVMATDDGGEGLIRAGDIQDSDRTVLAVADPQKRRAIAERLLGKPTSIIAPGVVVGQGVEIGEGAIFCQHTMVTCDSRIGRHFHANIYSYVAHDCVIGDFVTFAPRVNCNGNVTIGDGAYIGASATLRQGITIGAGAIVGMGAVVTKDVPPGETWMGNPAKAR